MAVDTAAAIMLTLSGGTYAAGLITGADVENGLLTGRDIRKHSVSADRLTDRTQRMFARSGRPGPQGAKGAQGIAGAEGADGANGDKGDAGTDGAVRVPGTAELASGPTVPLRFHGTAESGLPVADPGEIAGPWTEVDFDTPAKLASRTEELRQSLNALRATPKNHGLFE